MAYPRDRRQTPRLEVLGQVHGHIVSLDARMTALDLSVNGFSMETTFPIYDGEEHDFRLVGPNGVANRLRARATYCKRYQMSDGTPRFVTGLTFVDPANPGDDLVDQLLAVLSFDLG
jgi:hypothetical protein